MHRYKIYHIGDVKGLKIDLRDSGEPRGQVAKLLTTRSKLSAIILASH